MTSWERVSLVARCGGCGRHLDDGDPVLVTTLPGLKRRLIRCEACEGPAPPDLPAHIEKNSTTKRMTPLAKFAKPFRD